MNLHGFREESDAVHQWHPLVSQKKSYGIISRFELAEGGKSGATRAGAHNAIAVRVVAAEVALDRPEDFGVVIDSE
jgi:hypothetical protein